MLKFPLPLLCVTLTACSLAAAPAVRLQTPGEAPIPCATIQEALDLAEPGDTVELEPGVYHENIVFTRSGEAGEPITLKGAGAIIDGADPVLQQQPQGQWTPIQAEGGPLLYWHEMPLTASDLPGVNTMISRTGESGTHGSDRLIAAYATLQALMDNPRGEGSFRDATGIYVNLAGGEDPNGVGLSIGRDLTVIDLAGHSHIQIEGVEVRNGGMYGVRLGGAPYEDVTLSGVTVRNCWVGIDSSGVSDGGTDVLIERSRILNGMPREWQWHGGYIDGVGTYAEAHFDGPYQSVGLHVDNLTDSEIRECLIAGFWDGMAVRRQNVRVHHNTIEHIMDDGIELESPWSENIEFYNNHIRDAWTGISVTSDSPGPIYIYRNIVETTVRQTAMNPDTTNNGFGIKSGNDWAGKAQNIKFYHNTFYSNSYNLWEKLNDSAPDAWEGYDFVNNVFFSYSPKMNIFFRGLDAKNSGPDNHWESNLYNIDTPDESGALTVQMLAEQFMQVAPDGRDLHLRPGTPGKDSASDYPSDQGWPDSVAAWPEGRDRGAWEDGMAPDAIGAPADILTP
jgi:hypothetical protein